MPEGHTLHRLAIDHREDFAGQVVSASSPQGRFADEARRIDERTLDDVTAYGKHLFYDFGGGDIVHVHLGLFGKFLRHAPPPPPPPRPSVRLRLSSTSATVDLVGATDCSLIDPSIHQAILDRLGPDPLVPRADPGKAYAKLRRRRSAVGAALMDQSVLAGVGNVYRAEVLHVHGIHPEQPANTITPEQWEAMWSTLVRWMRRGVKQRRITTRRGGLHVYRREDCATCGSPVRRWDLARRWAYACERCQPLVRSPA